MPTEDDSVTSISVEETNELRKKLGLKPLITTAPKTEAEPEKPGQDTDDVVQRLDNVRRKRARETLVRGAGIADSIKKGESIAPKRKLFPNDPEEVDPLDLQSWAKKMGRVTKSTITAAENAVTYSDEEDVYDEPKPEAEAEPDGAKIKVLHKMDELDLVKGDGVTLTLRDVGVLEAEAEGMEEYAFLENAELVDRDKDRKKAEQKLKNMYGGYVPYNEDPGNHGFLKKYDEAINTGERFKLSSLADADDGFFVKLDERHEARNELEDEHVGYDTLSLGTQPKGKTELIDEADVFSTLSARKNKLKARPKRMNWDKIFAKNEAEELDLSDFVPTKLQKEAGAVELDDDDQLYNQISKRTAVKAKPEEPGGFAGHVDFDVPKTETPVEITATTEFCKVVKTPLEQIEDQEAERKLTVKPAEEEPKDENPNTLADVPLGDGISSALSFIKQRGDYIDRKSDAKPGDVQLKYLDAYGNEMVGAAHPQSAKEAFRQMSWTFHGKKPSMNKQEKRAKRMEKERLARKNPVEGVATMKALFTHQEKQGTSHLVLGNSNNS